MKINNSFEQGIYVVIILALEQDHAPVKSSVLSYVLDVSDSYLKKLLMRLSRNGLVISNASKQGGYQLSRSADQISLRDIYSALELDQNTFESSHYASQIFPHQAHVEQSETKLLGAIEKGLNGFYEELDKLKISELLEEGAWEKGTLRWEEYKH